MAQLKDKVDLSLQEGYILVLGVQILLGFDYRAVLEKGFDSLPRSSQYLKLASQSLLLVALALLITIGARHQIIYKGETRHSVINIVNKLAGSALLPFALGLGMDVYVASEKIAGIFAAVLIGCLTALAAFFFWYGAGMLHRASPEGAKHMAHWDAERKQEESMSADEEQSGGRNTPVAEKIRNVLVEIRVVLPGAQALLGFQLAGVLVEGFDKLPAASKWVHLLSLAAVALSVILLMTPAAYHRIAERGEDTEHFHRLVSRALIAAMVVLALGLAGDFYVVSAKILDSAAAGIVAAVLCLLLFYGLWFGLSIAGLRQRDRSRAGVPAAGGR